MLQFLQELFFAPPGELSDDEQDPDEQDGKSSNGLADPDDVYNLILVNNTWYILLRLHQVSCWALDDNIDLT